MIITLKKLARLGLFLGLLTIFAAIEIQLESAYDAPDHAIEGRDKMVPDFTLQEELYGEYDTSSPIRIPIEAPTIDLSLLRGVRLKTGAYGKRLEASSMSLTDTLGTVLCASKTPTIFLEDAWTYSSLDCPAPINGFQGPKFLNIVMKTGERWALFKGTDHHPAIQVVLRDPTYTHTFHEARNYGSLWSDRALSIFRVFTRVITALGLAFMVLPWPSSEKKTRVLWAAVVWLGVFYGQFFETVTFHNSDETQHAIGAIQATINPEHWTPRYEEMKILGGAVQLSETYAQASNPIVPGRAGLPWVSDDDYFVEPYARSGLYSRFAQPMAKFSLYLASTFSSFCKDPVAYLRFQISCVSALLLGLGFAYHFSQGRIKSAWLLICMSLIPATLSSLLTVWNYSILTAAGILFTVSLVPEVSRKSNERSLFLASLLIPILGELARSQILWFVAGPLAVVASWVSLSYRDSSRSRCVLGIAKSMAMSLALYLILLSILRAEYIPDRAMLSEFNAKICSLLGMPREFLGNYPMTALTGLQIGAWSGAAAFMLTFDYAVRFGTKRMTGAKFRVASMAWTWGLAVLVGVSIWKCWSIKDVQTLSSLASAPKYTFGAHFKEAYRALMSQTFSTKQDYFLVQTFFMAYGWLEVTGHWLVYVLFRGIVEFGTIMILISSIKNFRGLLLFNGPLIGSFFIYFVGLWYAAWVGNFTIVGRFIFPAIGLLYVPMILSSIEILCDSKNSRWPSIKAEGIIEALFIFILINAAYGAFYLLPLRFTVGI